MERTWPGSAILLYIWGGNGSMLVNFKRPSPLWAGYSLLSTLDGELSLVRSSRQCREFASCSLRTGLCFAVADAVVLLLLLLLVLVLSLLFGCGFSGAVLMLACGL